MAPGGVDVELCPRMSLEFRGSPELQNGGLRALEEAWDDFLLETFFCQVWSFFCGSGSSQAGARRFGVASLGVSGGQGEPRASERWPESSGRGIFLSSLVVFLSFSWTLLCSWAAPRLSWGPLNCSKD